MNQKHSEHNNNNFIQSSFKSCFIGSILSIILTAIPFFMVMNNSASKNTLIAVLVVCAIIQIIVYLICFMHLNISPETQWNLISLIFTIIIITILILGSLWIMTHLNHNLMNHS